MRFGWFTVFLKWILQNVPDVIQLSVLIAQSICKLCRYPKNLKPLLKEMIFRRLGLLTLELKSVLIVTVMIS